MSSQLLKEMMKDFNTKEDLIRYLDYLIEINKNQNIKEEFIEIKEKCLKGVI